MKKLIGAIQKAETMVTNHPENHKALANLLDHAYYLGEQFPREIMAECIQEQCRPDSQALKNTCFAIYNGSPTTADANERTFGWVADKARAARNSVMADKTKWFYLSTSPYAAQGGMPGIETTEADYSTCAHIYPELVKELNNDLKHYLASTCRNCVIIKI